MKNKYVVTIARQYGAGGRTVGRLLAEQMNAVYIDNNVVEKAAKLNGVNAEFYKEFDEKPSRRFSGMFTFSVPTNGFFMPLYSDLQVQDKLFYTQATIIKEETKDNNAVVVGRCGDYILRERENVIRVFLRADKDCRIKRIMNEYNLTADNMNKVIIKADKQRANYYNTYTDRIWGDIDNYDLTINTSKLDLDQVVNIIINFIETIDEKNTDKKEE